MHDARVRIICIAFPYITYAIFCILYRFVFEIDNKVVDAFLTHCNWWVPTNNIMFWFLIESDIF